MENTIYTMATAFDAAGNVTAWLTEPDPAIVPIVAEATALANELGSVVIGTDDRPLQRAAQRPGVVNGVPRSWRTAAASRRSAISSPTSSSGR